MVITTLASGRKTETDRAKEHARIWKVLNNLAGHDHVELPEL